MNKKEEKMKQYVMEIYKKEPVKPSELSFKRVRYDYLDLLKARREIVIRKYGKGYTLLAGPGHEGLCNERANRDLYSHQKKDAFERGDLTFKKEIIERIVIPFIRQMSGITINNHGVMIPCGSLGRLRKYPQVKLDVEKDPLFSEFVTTCKGVVPNPGQEYEKFQLKSKEFLDNYMSISNEIRAIALKKIAMGTASKDKTASVKLIRPFIHWIEKEAHRLFKRSEKEQKSVKEIFNSGFKDIRNNFHSHVKEEGDSYTYIFIYSARPRYPPVKLLCWTVNKKTCKSAEFQKQMDKRIRNVIKNIAQSEKIIHSFNSIITLKEEWTQQKNNVIVGLEKYKASYSPNNHSENIPR
jgi:hypothetical protein